MYKGPQLEGLGMFKTDTEAGVSGPEWAGEREEEKKSENLTEPGPPGHNSKQENYMVQTGILKWVFSVQCNVHVQRGERRERKRRI